MDETTATTVVIGITAVGAVAWLAALTVMLRATREQRGVTSEAAELFDVEGARPAGAIVGGADVDGQPEALAAKLAEQLARSGLGPFGPVKIVSCDRGEVAFDAAATDLGAAGYGGSGFRRGRARFKASGHKTRIDYTVESSPRGILLVIGWAALGLGLLALVIVPWLEFTYVLPHANQRTQALQTMQMIHFLWPPFLVAFLSRQPARVLRAQMDSLVHNLPYT
jgi:hypothetical protein